MFVLAEEVGVEALSSEEVVHFLIDPSWSPLILENVERVSWYINLCLSIPVMAKDRKNCLAAKEGSSGPFESGSDSDSYSLHSAQGLSVKVPLIDKASLLGSSPRGGVFADILTSFAKEYSSSPLR